jgi:hypothetical protein
LDGEKVTNKFQTASIEACRAQIKRLKAKEEYLRKKRHNLRTVVNKENARVLELYNEKIFPNNEDAEDEEMPLADDPGNAQLVIVDNGDDDPDL